MTIAIMFSAIQKRLTGPRTNTPSEQQQQQSQPSWIIPSQKTQEPAAAPHHRILHNFDKLEQSKHKPGWQDFVLYNPNLGYHDVLHPSSSGPSAA